MPDLRIEKVVVTGGRGFTDAQRIAEDLDVLLSLGLLRVAHGDAAGADALAEQAFLSGVTKKYAADWKSHRRRAGLIRNVRMLEAEQPDLVLAYPDPLSSGTWHCVREALRRRISVLVWAPEHAIAVDSERGLVSIEAPSGRRVLDRTPCPDAYAPEDFAVGSAERPRFVLGCFVDAVHNFELAEVFLA